jgi:diguanylate cyclase (GGDEF)-like protein
MCSALRRVDAARVTTGPVLRRGLRAWILLLVLGALAVSLRDPGLNLHDTVVLLALPLLCAVDVELGRRAEGGRVDGQRPSKGLSAWPFAAALLCSSTLVLLVTAPTYAYARWRGMKVPLAKWVGSGAILSLAAAGSQLLAPSLTHAGLGTFPRLVLAGAVFLAVEVGCFAVCTVVGEREDEAWLRGQLRSRSFYVAEVSVLSQAAVVAVLWAASPLLVLLVVPSYGVLQRALMHAPLREAADTDNKTGLLHLHAWEARAATVLEKGHGFSVLLLDLDHFKAVNDEHGHLVGDDVLRMTGELVRAHVRPSDVPARFGGEEFVVLLPDADVIQALAVAERLRAAVEECDFDGLRLTASIGVFASGPTAPERMREGLACADLALYQAKSSGRNVVRSYRPPANGIPVQRAAAFR